MVSHTNTAGKGMDCGEGIRRKIVSNRDIAIMSLVKQKESQAHVQMNRDKKSRAYPHSWTVRLFRKLETSV